MSGLNSEMRFWNCARSNAHWEGSHSSDWYRQTIPSVYLYGNHAPISFDVRVQQRYTRQLCPITENCVKLRSLNYLRLF